MIQTFNEANEKKRLNLECWPVKCRAKERRHCDWIVVVITDAHELHPEAANCCHIRIGDYEWWEATRLENPSPTILLRGHEYGSFVTYQVKVPRHSDDQRQPHFSALELSVDASGAQRPICEEDDKLWSNLRLSMKSTPKLTDQLLRRHMPDPSWKIDDAKQYCDIYRYGTEKEFEFQANAISQFNRRSVYKCWLVMCGPNKQGRRRAGPVKVERQQCIVIVALRELHESFPKVGDPCDLAFAVKIPVHDPENIDFAQHNRNPKTSAHDIRSTTATDNQSLKRLGIKYFRGVRVDNPNDKIYLDGSKWSNCATFKVVVNWRTQSTEQSSPFAKFQSKLDISTLEASHVGGPRPRITLNDEESFEAHVWLDVSDTTMSVELNALKTAMSASAGSRVERAFSYIRGFEKEVESLDLFRAFPQMHDPDGHQSQLPQSLKLLYRHLDDDQKAAYRTLLSGLPCRIGIFPGGPGVGKTHLMLTIAALALSRHSPLAEPHAAVTEHTPSSAGPILLIVEANRPADALATRVVEHFKTLGRRDLLILRAYNFNYEGAWHTRNYLQVEEDGKVSSDSKFEACFPTHRADHIPQVCKGGSGDCRAQTLRDAAQQYLTKHAEDFPKLSGLLNLDSEAVDSEDQREYELRQEEWYNLFRAVLARTDFVVTTTVGASKIATHASEHFRPQLVIFDDAARARELSTLVAIANFPSAQAWLFTGTCETTKPYVGSYGKRDLWNPCVHQLRTSMIERRLNVTSDTHSLSLNHQTRGDIHFLSSDIFWDGQIQSAFEKHERFPPSTLHLLEYCKNLAMNQELSIPRLLVHVKGSTMNSSTGKSKSNDGHLNWVIQRAVRDLVQDRQFRSTDNQPGSIIITTPYKAQFSNYRKAINDLMRELDREHRTAGGSGKGYHREVLVEARTADTVQGHSADLVIFDLVHSEATPHIDDANRMCVALTRAKQAELLIMQRAMVGTEGLDHGRRRFDGTYVDLVYDHCKAHGQIITVEGVETDKLAQSYILQRDGASSGRDRSAVPRQLPSVPRSLALPQSDGRVEVSSTSVGSNSQSGKEARDGYDDGNPISGENFSFEMVKKALQLGLS
ncbi:hypothetical protein J7T55_009823 [Diaporthe amygdali]|uniref:uncharacterized protein n=1 Tax=Phomopsis amygdali TaxID=1214568 RepID=UPI0022FDCF2A|nr:uncharacterized protein J7T55_009823 [Diaporthe amygdali]KAJ0116673.1 hypothetical protein J7T55_009823 [Diaporthe amygdali]